MRPYSRCWISRSSVAPSPVSRATAISRSGTMKIEVHRRPMAREAALHLGAAQLRGGRTVAEQKDRQIGAVELDPTRAEPPLQRQAQPVAIERDPAFEIGDIDIGVDLDHRVRTA